MTDGTRVVRIGGASGMWGDSAIATPQLLAVPGLHYLSYDYLAETTMSILARAKATRADAGYATDFVTLAMAGNLEAIKARGVRVLSNAGGLNAEACRDAVVTQARARGFDLRVAVVTGDDVLAVADDLRRAGVRDVAGRPMPAGLLSANAYLGARAVHRALECGAEMVITGRVVDSAFVVAALVHEFGWEWHDWDRIAQATLAGHLIECGAQATGGLFTDWHTVPEWDAIGYPVLECSADGTFVVTKPSGTGGLVSPPAVAEQVVYEIGDPAAYLMPDVTADFRSVCLEPDGAERVRVAGAVGGPPPEMLKVSGTYTDGFRLDALLAIRGIDAAAKASRTADALLARTRAQMAAHEFSDYTDVCVELLGTESLYGPHARATATREVVLRIAACHPVRAALEHLRREVTSPGTSMGPGTRGHFGGRSDIFPVVRLCSFEIARSAVVVTMTLDGVVETLNETLPVTAPAGGHAAQTPTAASAPAPEGVSPEGSLVSVPLVCIAYARSGDKGNTSNIGVVARTPALWPWLRQVLTTDVVRRHLAHLVDGRVERFDLPGLHAVNFVLHDALGGGGMASLRSDPLGKSFAQILLDLPVQVPAHLVPPRPQA